MATLQFRQGDQRLSVVEHATDVTIQADDEHDAADVAAQAEVEMMAPARAAPGLIRASIVGDRDAAMARLRTRAVVHHVYRSADDRRQEVLITDSFHVKFKPGTTPDRIAEYLQREHLSVQHDLGDGLLLVKVTDRTGHNSIRAANDAGLSADVEYAEPNLIREVQPMSAVAPYYPSDTLFPRQWHLHAPRNEGNDLLAGAGIYAPEAWSTTRGSRDIVVAVADDGFDVEHPDFQGAGKIAGALNLVPTGNDFAVDGDVMPRPGNYHGTPCAGVAIAESDGLGVVGVAPACAFLPVRFPLSMSEHHFVLMFERISRLADVVSCSWGFGPANAPMSSVLRDRLAAIARTGGRRGKGLVICVAAGNNNCPIKDRGNTSSYQFIDGSGQVSSYAGPIDRWIASHPDVITVSACTSLKERAAYSSWGNEVSVCAPSDNWDDLRRTSTVGRGIVTTDNEGFGSGTDFTPGSRFTAQFGGTSSATPTVAGVCALVLSRNPALTAAEVRDIVRRTSDKDLMVRSATPVNIDGAFKDGVSPWYGHGKVNAARAVAAALAPGDLGLVRRTNATAVGISDGGEPASSTIDIAERGTIVELRVFVELDHAGAGELHFDLVAPDGRAVSFDDPGVRPGDGQLRSYGQGNVPALGVFVGSAVQGKWSLRVWDALPLSQGQLTSWSLVARTNRAQGRVPAHTNGKASNGAGAHVVPPVPGLADPVLQLDTIRHDVLLITPQDEFYRFPVDKDPTHQPQYHDAPWGPAAEDEGTRKVRNLAAQGTGGADDPRRGPIFATLPLNPEPAATSALTCYLVNTRNLEYRNPWTREDWSQVPRALTAIATEGAAFKLLIAGPDSKIYLLEKQSGDVNPTVREAERDNPEVWTQLRNGTVVGRAMYFDASDNSEVVPLVNITSLTPTPPERV